MTVGRVAWALASLALVVDGCSRAAPAPLPSPSGTLVAMAEVSGDEAGPTRRYCVRLRVREVATGRTMEFQTGASDGQKWATAWAPGGALVLYSSDIGTRAYDVEGGRIAERPPDEAERQVGRDAYRAKYGRPPRR